MLEMKSLQLDMVALRQEREDDRHEFLAFKQTVQKFFQSIETNFQSIQSNFERLFSARKGDSLTPSTAAQASSAPETPPNSVHQFG